MGEVGVPPALEAAVESLREAVTAGRTDIVRRLLDACDSCDGGGTEERKQLINSHCVEDGGTFLHLATQLGHGDIVRALLSAGGDPGVVNSKGNTPTQVSCKPAVTAVYIEELLRATAQSDLGRVCQLLAGGLSVNSHDNAVSRNTPLHWAAAFADTDTLHCLIARGADVHSLNSDGVSALHDAVARGAADVVTALLQHGARPNEHRCSAGRHKGMTPLEMAAQKGGAVFAAVQQHNNNRGISLSTNTRNKTDSLDMRALAGSLESLNSIGGDSILLSNGGPIASRSLTNGSLTNNTDISVHNNTGKKSLDMVGRRSRIVSFDQSICEDARNYNGDDESGPASTNPIVNGYPNYIKTDSSSSYVQAENVIKASIVEGVSKDAGVVDFVDGALQRRPKNVSLSRSPIHSTSSVEFSTSIEQQMHNRLSVYGRSNCNGPPTPLVTSARLHLLWPQPRHMVQDTDQYWVVPRVITVAMVADGPMVHSMSDVLEVHRARLESSVGGGGDVEIRVVGGVRRLHTCCDASVVITILPPALATTPLHYTLAVTNSGVRISCGSLSSLHSALATLVQLLRVHSSDTTPAVDGKPTKLGFSSATAVTEPTTPRSANLLRQASEPPKSVSPIPVSLLRSQSEDITLSSKSTNIGTEIPNGTDVTTLTDIKVECVVITDVPDVPHRAFMLDAAPLARIPTLSTMYHIVESMTSMKMNQLHLMMRLQPVTLPNTTSAFNNTDHTVDNGAGLGSLDKNKSTCYCPLPYEPNDLMALSRYCRDRGVVLVPAFDLDQSWNGGRTASLAILELTAVIANTLTHFCDTNFVSVGPALTSVLALSNIINNNVIINPWEYLGLSSDDTLIVCANVLKGIEVRSAEYNVPYGALLMEYGFQADHEFGPALESAMRNGRSHAVCTGTAAWSSLAGFPEVSAYNVYEGIVDKRSAVSVESGNSISVVVIAHWSTPASLTPLVFVWPSLVVGAGLAWNGRTHFDYVNSSIGLLIDTHLVQVSDCGFGKAMVELGRCETWLTREMRNQDNHDLTNLPPASTGPGSTLHQLLADPDSVVLEHLSGEKFGSVLRHIKRSIRNIVNNRVVSSEWPLMPVAAAELNLSADLMMTACRLGRALVTVGSNPHSNLGMAVVNPGLTHLPPTLRTDVANRLLSLRESYSCLWLHSHQPPGLQASLLLLSSLLTRLLPQHDNIQNL